LVYELAHRVIIVYRLERIRQELHFQALIGNQAAYQQIVSGTILDGRVPTKSGKMRARGGDGRTESEFDSIQLPSHEDARVEIRQHASGLQAVRQRAMFGRNVEAGDGASARVRQRPNNLAQIVRANADVAIADDQMLVARFGGKTRQLRDFIIRRVAP